MLLAQGWKFFVLIEIDYLICFSVLEDLQKIATLKPGNTDLELRQSADAGAWCMGS